jgi:hypothetical protein
VQVASHVSHFDLSVGVFEFNGILYGIVYFPKVGPFVIVLGHAYNLPNRPIREGL